MPYLAADPGILTAVAAEIDDLGSAINAAHSAVAGPTSSLAAAAGDEVSTAIAKLFNEYGLAYQSAFPQAASFHGEFTRALAAAAGAYSEAETAASSTLGAFQPGAQATLGGGAAKALPAATFDALAMGGTGNPLPSPDFVNGLLKWATTPPFGQFSVQSAIALATPEQLYPLTGVKSLPLTTSVSQGVTILNNALFGPGGQLTIPGNNALVVSYSQSSIISSLEMRNILATPQASWPSNTQLAFTLLADPMNPNGGLFARFPGLTLPSMGLNFYGATPSNTPWTTDITSIEYDGFADFPRYPINIVSDLNAFAGIISVHPLYPHLDPSTIPPGDIVHLQTDPTYTGVNANTNYYMVLHENLPLLDPIRAIPVIGNPIADLIQPDLKVIVNLGYGDPAYGYSTSYANVPTPFGLFPHVPLSVIANDLVSGTQQGVHDFSSDILNLGPPALPDLSLSNSLSEIVDRLPSLPSPATLLTPAGITGLITALQTANTSLVNAISSAASSAYATLLPTADVINAALTSIPSYDVNLFLSGVEQAISGDPLGGLEYAFVAPVAADFALVTLAGGFEALTLLFAVAAIAKDFTALIP